MSDNFDTNPPEDGGMKPADPQAETDRGAQEMTSEGAPVPAPEPKTAGTSSSARMASETLKDALRSVENVGQVLGQALQGRGNVVMVRVNDETLKHMDILVEAEVTKSRSESAALLINEGIKANQALFSQITEIANQISELRAKLRESVKAQKLEE